MTITSGLAQVGKTHLAINLALELVRRGHLAGVFHDPGQIPAVDEMLGLPHPATSQRRTAENGETAIIRRGYLGVDVLSAVMPVGGWLDLDAAQLSRYRKNIDTREGYDDFLIDTSGMEARSLLACCKASAVVIIILTPESRSQVESFALLRVLQLNGFSGELCILVNKVVYPVDSYAMYSKFYRMVKARLGLEVALLGWVPEDRYVQLAQQNRHAFSSLFPDSRASGAVVAAVDALDDIPAHFVAGPQTLPAFLDAIVDVLQAPVCLPGGVVLEDEPGQQGERGHDDAR
jgi:flagellar biosynthesis protein FlhG